MMNLPSQVPAAAAIDRRSALAVLVGGLALAAGGCSSATAQSGRIFAVAAFRRSGMSDLAVLRAAMAQWSLVGGTLRLEPSYTYNLGSSPRGQPWFSLVGLTDMRIDGAGAVLRCESRPREAKALFHIAQCSNIVIADLKAVDIAVDLAVDWQGMKFVDIDGSAGTSRNIALEDVEIDGAVAMLACSGQNPAGRVSGIRIDRCTARRCYYGTNFQENGDSARLSYRAIDCRRAYFPYGVVNHRASLDIASTGRFPGADACILIVSRDRRTQSIAVSANLVGVLNCTTIVKLEQQPVGGRHGEIADIDITLNIDSAASDPFGAAALTFSAYRGGTPVAVSDDQWSDVTLSGEYGVAIGEPLRFLSQPGRRASLTLAPGPLTQRRGARAGARSISR